MEITEDTDARLVLSRHHRSSNWAYHAFAAFWAAFGAAFVLLTDLPGIGYAMIASAVAVSIYGFLSRNNWDRLILDRDHDNVALTLKSALNRTVKTMPLSAVHSVVVKQKEVTTEHRRITLYRVVIRPLTGSGHYAIGFSANMMDAYRLADRLNAWIGIEPGEDGHA
jgi:uncharacterized membrane protein